MITLHHHIASITDSATPIRQPSRQPVAQLSPAAAARSERMDGLIAAFAFGVMLGLVVGAYLK